MAKLSVKARICRVEILAVQLILRDAQGITDFTLSNRVLFCLTGKGKL